MIERVALHQTRFRTPGVYPDPRGVVLGQRGVVLFASLDRLVAFLRAYGEEGSLDELIPSLEIRRVQTSLRARELVLMVHAESSYRMDRIAGIARLTGGLVFTGTQRHYVKYRDAASPLGYDLQELLDEGRDLVLYHDSFRQSYELERELELRDLVLKLEPRRLPPSERHAPARLYVTVESGVARALVSYLFRWRVEARVAAVEWPPASAFEDRPRRLHVFEVQDVPPRIVRLLSELPGAHLFEPLGEQVAVELGFEHPVALESCASLFQDRGLHLFRGDGHVTRVHPLPPFAPVRSLVHVPLARIEEPDPARPSEEMAALRLPLRLAPTSEPPRRVVASTVPFDQRRWLARLLYALPPDTLRRLQLAVGTDRFYLLCPTGIEGVPLGTFYGEVASRIYVPVGFALVPSVAAPVLEELIGERGGHVFFDRGHDESPWVVPNAAFGPISRRILREVAAVTVHADRPLDSDPALPLFQYGKARAFPLWGAPGKPARDEGEGAR